MTITHARSVKARQGAALAKVQAGTLTLAEALRQPPDALQRVDLYVLLMRCPGIGRDRCRTLCERAQVWPHLTLGELTKNERRRLLDNLPGRAQ